MSEIDTLISAMANASESKIEEPVEVEARTYYWLYVEKDGSEWFSEPLNIEWSGRRKVISVLRKLSDGWREEVVYHVPLKRPPPGKGWKLVPKKHPSDPIVWHRKRTWPLYRLPVSKGGKS